MTAPDFRHTATVMVTHTGVLVGAFPLTNGSVSFKPNFVSYPYLFVTSNNTDMLTNHLPVLQGTDILLLSFVRDRQTPPC